ncbi:MAG: hypothetical protein IJ655_06010 [Lachnospiraceae bacterium]|nr:hypothetical protein [Lachnospiraceae bacterium]
MNRFDNVKVTRNKLIILFALSVILRFIICNYFPKTINCYPDELLYLSAAESLWNNHGVMVYNLATTFKKVGYSFFIAPAFALGNIHVRMSVIGFINSVLMSAGIFPVYGMARRFFKRNSFIWLSILFYMISPSMTYSMTFASENLYIPVSLVVLYVIVEVEARWREYMNEYADDCVKVSANVSAKSGAKDGAKADINDVANDGGNITSFIIKNIGLLILGIGAWILAYITKELALVIPLALVAYMFMSKIVMSVRGDSRSYDSDNVGNAADGACEIDSNNSYGVAGAKNKSGLGSAIKLLVAGIAIVALVYGIWWFCNRGSNYYQLGINTEILSQRWGYLLYGFGFFVTISIVGLLVVPVLLPMTVKNQMNSNAKRLYYIMLLIILGTAAIVAYTIYMYEDYPSITPRAHVRYVEYLYVPFLMVLMTMWERRAIDAAKANVTMDKPTTTGKTENIISDVAAVDSKSDASKLNWPGIIMAAVCLGGMNFIFNGFNGQTIDHTTLFYMQLFASEGKTFSPMAANLLILAITVVTLVLMGLYSTGSHGFNKAQDTSGEQASGARSSKIGKTKIFWEIFITGAIIMSLGNSVLSGYIQYKTHTHSGQETAEIYDIRDFVRNHNDDTFLVMESAAGEEMLDTFLMDCDNLVYASEGILFEQALLGDTGIDLDVAPVWGRDVTGGVNYDDIRDIDYVIVFTDVYALKGEADVIGEYPANQCVVYKLRDTRQLPIFAQAQ